MGTVVGGLTGSAVASIIAYGAGSSISATLISTAITSAFTTYEVQKAFGAFKCYNPIARAKERSYILK